MAYDKELAFAKKLAHEAGDIMQKYYRVDEREIESKADFTPVTIADKTINSLLIERVKAVYPDHGVLGEEESWNPDRNTLWVCDPIDGTIAYINHIPTSMFSLALVQDGKPVVAVTYNPWTDDEYSAVKGEGAWRNNERIHVLKDVANVVPTTVGCTGSKADGIISIIDREQVLEAIERKGWFTVNTFGMVFKCCLVAEGSISGHIFGGRGAHDIAAAKLIVEEAGGKVTNLRGEDQLYNAPVYGAIVSNNLIHEELLEVVGSKSEA